ASPRPGSSPIGNPGVHVVAPGDTLSKISRMYGKPLAEVARSNNLAPSAQLKVGDRIVIPGGRASQIPPKTAPAVAQTKPAAQPAAKEPANESVGVAQAPD